MRHMTAIVSQANGHGLQGDPSADPGILIDNGNPLQTPVQGTPPLWIRIDDNQPHTPNWDDDSWFCYSYNGNDIEFCRVADEPAAFPLVDCNNTTFPNSIEVIGQLVTNGFLPEQVLAKMPSILKIDPDIGVAVSLDGLKTVHERLRGVRGGFDKAFRTIQILRNLGVKNLKIAFTLNDINASELPKVYNLSRSLGIEFSLAVCHNSAHFFDKQDTQPKDLNQISRAINWLIKQELKGFWPSKRWARAYFAYGALRYLQTNYRILPDYSGINSLFIDPFGQIYPSDVWNLPLGQLQQQRNWPVFIAQCHAKILSAPQAPASWMICTARSAMKNHQAKVMLWILKRKLSGI